MSIQILVANILTFVAFFIHTFVGDRELRVIEPEAEMDDDHRRQGKWTMARCGWHWISLDLLFASIGLGLINFTDFFKDGRTLLYILAVYFFGYAAVWAFTILISRPFPRNYLKLGQWIFLLVVGGLILWGAA